MEINDGNMVLEKTEKKKVVYLRHSNCCKIRPNDWMETEWTVYNDGSVDKTMFFNGNGHDKRKSTFILRVRLYKKLIRLVEKAMSLELGVGVRNADAWEFKYFDDTENVIWHRELDSIEDIKELEKIARRFDIV